MPMLHSYQQLLTAYTMVLNERKNATRSIFEAAPFDADALRAVLAAVR